MIVVWASARLPEVYCSFCHFEALWNRKENESKLCAEKALISLRWRETITVRSVSG